jgi:hypothetical protein
MIRHMKPAILILTLALTHGMLASADELVLRSGQHLHGIYYGGSPRSIRFAVDSQPDVIREYPEQNIQAIYLGDDQQAAPQPASIPRYSYPATGSGVQIPSPAPVPVKAIPAGTSCVVRLIDSIDSRRDNLGQTYRASLDQPIYVGGQLVATRGSNVVLVLIDDQNSGHVTGKTVLTVAVQSLTINGRAYDVATTAVTKASGSRTTQSAERIGGGTALGAVIGGLAGGGRAAAIGALSGAAAGTIAQVVTSGQRVKVPSETRLTFTLKESLPL